MTNTSPSNRYARLIQPRFETATPPRRQGSLPIRKVVHDLWPALNPGISALQAILKSVSASDPSLQSEGSGELPLPFDFAAAQRFKHHNTFHSACLEVRKQSMVGLGHVLESETDEQSKAAETLNPLCRVSWQTILAQVAEDYSNVGNCYIEVRRKGGDPLGPISGLHYLPAADVRIYLEDERGIDSHFVVLTGDNVSGLLPRRTGGMLRMAQFGDLARFKQKYGEGDVSEVIHIPRPAVGVSRWYGFPDWLAATGYVELTQAVLQSQFDLFSNRGVPELLLFLLGGRIDDETWSVMKTTMDSMVGIGQWGKSGMFNLHDPNLKVQVERLALDNILNGEFFQSMMETLSTTIVSAHRVPPSLAGILIPGKMGAANEATNAILSFQILCVGPDQHHVQTILGTTLGNPKFNGGLGLTMKNFKFATIVDAMQASMAKLKPADTLGRMRDELPKAQAEGRDLEEGVQKDMTERVRSVLADEGLMSAIVAAAIREQAKAA